MTAHSPLALCRHKQFNPDVILSLAGHTNHIFLRGELLLSKLTSFLPEPQVTHLSSLSALRTNAELESLGRLCWHFQPQWYIWAWVKIKMKKKRAITVTISLLLFRWCQLASYPASYLLHSVWLHFLSIKDCSSPSLHTRNLWIITHNIKHFLPIEI